MTRYGGQLYHWLIEQGYRAEVEAPVDPAERTYGDPRIIDPLTGQPVNLYEAVKQHYSATGQWPDFLPESFKGDAKPPAE